MTKNSQMSFIIPTFLLIIGRYDNAKKLASHQEYKK